MGCITQVLLHDGVHPQWSYLGTHNQFSNNLFHNCGPFYQVTPQNTVTADPQFVNYINDGSGNYHLLSTSPSIRCWHIERGAGPPTMTV